MPGCLPELVPEILVLTWDYLEGQENLVSRSLE